MKRDIRKYILRKLVELIFTLLFVTLLSFLLMRLSSVDPATAYAKRMIGNPTAEQIEKIRVQLGFDKPLLVQYGRWVWDLLHFDLGVSLANGHDVWTDIATAFPKTLGIVCLASVFQVIFIVIVSCIAFLLPWKFPKKAVRLLCIFGVSIPSFYLATVYLDYFAVQKSLISVAGNTTLLSYISPAICIGVFGASFYTPLLMDALEHESNEDYAFYARCRGLSEKRLLLCHFLPRAAIGLVPNFLQSIGLALANATVIESIFSIPGFGYLIVNHVLDRDTPMIHAEVFFLALAIALCNIAADLCALLIPTFVIVFFFVGFLFAPNNPMESNLLARYADPSAEYPFGTDALGRCILSRILYGGWTTLGIVLGGSLIVFLTGTVIGMVTSRAVMKENALIDGLINAVTAIPPIAYLIVFIGAWGSGAKTTLVALTVSYILRYIKLVRTRTDMEMGKAYVMCAIAAGASKFRIMLIHIFPNLFAEMIRFLCLSCADMILAITGFSFIGLGLGDNVVDWGSMILDARGALVLHPTLILYPIGAVIISTLCFNVIGRQLTAKGAE